MNYYRPSGKISPRVGLWLAASVVALMPIAWVYAWLMLFARVGPLILLFSIVFGGCCARAAYLTAAFGKARNPERIAWIGAGIGLIGWYWQWVAWLTLASTQSSVAALLNHTTTTMIDFATSPRSMYVLAMQIRDGNLVGRVTATDSVTVPVHEVAENKRGPVEPEESANDRSSTHRYSRSRHFDGLPLTGSTEND